MNVVKKPAITIIGGILVMVGIILLVTPGPGLIVIAAGVAVWATEYAWAERWLARIKAKLRLKNNKPQD